MTDWIPVISQVKTIVQYAFGDPEAAWKTQENFFKRCPVVSHAIGVTLSVAVIFNKREIVKFAAEAWIGGTKTLFDVIDGIPIAGHVKGGIHHWVGDHEGGNKALISATRTLAVMAVGAWNFTIDEQWRAIAGGMCTGIAFDGIHTLADKDGPHGIWALGQRHKVGDIFDILVGIVSDGLTGYATGTYFEKEKLRSLENEALKNIRAKRAELNLNEPVANLEVWSEVTDLETGKKYYGNNTKIRTKTNLTSEPRDPSRTIFVEKVPVDAELPIHRAAETCAEAHGLDQLLRDRPVVDTINSRVNTFSFKDGEFKNTKRCDNCWTRADAMGRVPIDPLPSGFDLDVPDYMPSECYEYTYNPESWFFKEYTLHTHADYNRCMDNICLGLLLQNINESNEYEFH